LFITDSHTCNAGALLVCMVGNVTDVVYYGTGKLLIKVPATMRFVLTVKFLPAGEGSHPAN